MNMHTVVHEGHALQTVSAILYSGKKHVLKDVTRDVLFHRDATETQKTKIVYLRQRRSWCL